MSLVRSNLEFGSIIWSSNYSKYINELDNVQYKFLKRISYITNIHTTRDTVNIIENFLSLDSLNIRCQIADIMLVYDILNNLIDCPDLLSKIGFRVPCTNTRNMDLFVIPKIPIMGIVRSFQVLLFWPIRYQSN